MWNVGHPGSVATLRVCQGSLDLLLTLFVNEKSDDSVVLIEVILFSVIRSNGNTLNTSPTILFDPQGASTHYVVPEFVWSQQKDYKTPLI